MRRIFAVAVALLLGRFVLFDVPFSDDDLTHWLIARQALTDPWYFLDIWGRPGFTVLHALPAQAGFIGCQILSAILSLACAWIVGIYCGRRGAFLAGVGFATCFFQPQFYFLADGALTETVYAFVVAVALLLISRGQVRWACLALSWGAITRLEGMPMLPVYWLGLVLDDLRRPLELQPRPREHVIRLLLLGVFPFTWNFIYSAVLGFESLLPIFTENVFVTAPNSYYGHGKWYSYLASAWNIHGPVFFVFVGVGCVVLARRREHFVPLSVGVFWLMQSVLWAGGFMRTGGYDRFFVSITPLAAVAATAGAAAVIHRAGRKLPRRALRVAILAVLVFSILWCAVEDFTWTGERQQHYDAVADACELIESTGGVTEGRRLYTQAILPRAILDLDPTLDAKRLFPLVPDTLAEAPPGSLVLITGVPGWDSGMPLLSFYQPDQEAMADAARARSEPWVDKLAPDRLLPRYREVGDFSVLHYWAAPTLMSRWPYYVKVLEITER